MKELSVRFPSGGITLEGCWHLPEGGGALAAVALCHPHPLYGGSMDNNVVYALAWTLAERGLAALRFNFRGVGGSGGSFAQGEGEARDLEAALSYMGTQPWVEAGKMGVAGYSFGAGVALKVAAQDPRVKALALISFPVAMTPLDGLRSYSGAKLVVYGDRDFACPAAEMEGQLRQIWPPPEKEVFGGADHFWWGYEEMLAGRVALFFAQFLL